jgi:hypothetical protein
MSARDDPPLKIPAVKSRGRVGLPSSFHCTSTARARPSAPWHGVHEIA